MDLAYCALGEALHSSVDDLKMKLENTVNHACELMGSQI